MPFWWIRSWRGRAFAQQVAMLAVHHELTGLVVDRGAHHDDSGRAARQELGDRERWIERVTHVDRLQEARRLLEEGDERIPDHVGKHSSSGGRLRRDQEPVSEKGAVAVGLTVD